MERGPAGQPSEISYKNIPFYITIKDSGISLDNEGDAPMEIAPVEKVDKILFSVEGERRMCGGGGLCLCWFWFFTM